MKSELNLRWTGKMSFCTEIDGHKLSFDAADTFGGENKGPRPKALIMASLAGCTAMDVVSLLEKMRVSYKTFDIHVVADLADDHPKRYNGIKLIYKLSGDNIDLEKVNKAIRLSEERYCGVWATLKNSVKISYEIEIN